jgi:hypothetical protein
VADIAQQVKLVAGARNQLNLLNLLLSATDLKKITKLKRGYLRGRCVERPHTAYIWHAAQRVARGRIRPGPCIATLLEVAAQGDLPNDDARRIIRQTLGEAGRARGSARYYAKRKIKATSSNNGGIRSVVAFMSIAPIAVLPIFGK